MGRVVGLVLVLFAAAATPALCATSTSLGSAGNPPLSDGHQIVWSAGLGAIHTLDPRSGRRATRPIAPGCRAVAGGPGVLALRCPGPPVSSFADDEATGALTALPGVDDADAIGAQWVAFLGGDSCDHCETVSYLNWHTGARVDLDPMTDAVPIDLDSARFRRIPLDLRSRYGLGDVAARGATTLATVTDSDAPRGRVGEDVLLVEHGRRRLVAHCHDLCGHPLLTAGRAYWIDGDRLRAVGLRSHRRVTWRYPGGSGDGTRLLQAAGRVVGVRVVGLGGNSLLRRFDG